MPASGEEEGAEGELIAGDGEPHPVLEPELLLRLPELRPIQVGDREDEAPPVRARVHHEVPPRHVLRRAPGPILLRRRRRPLPPGRRRPFLAAAPPPPPMDQYLNFGV